VKVHCSEDRNICALKSGIAVNVVMVITVRCSWGGRQDVDVLFVSFRVSTANSVPSKELPSSTDGKENCRDGKDAG
jgi:hypothetical protein